MNNKNPNHELKAKIFAGLIVVIFFVWLFYPSSNSKKDDDKPTKQSAVVQSHLCVKDYLKSPATAEFPFQPDETIEQTNDSTFVVLSYVDSQNSFGALVRMYYKCKVIYSSNGNARCEDVKLSEK